MSRKRPDLIPHKCHVCGGELKAHERAEGFCDACLRKAQQYPLIQADKRDRAEGVR